MRLEIRAITVTLLSSLFCVIQNCPAQTNCPTCNVTPASCSAGGCNWWNPYTETSQPDLFYNYYAPSHCGATAAAFPAPYPTPAHVGHTYYTYQPLMPNEFLYRHHRSYHQYYNNGMGLTRTKVTWYHNPFSVLHGATRQFLSCCH